MNYLELIQPDAEKTLKPLHDAVLRIEKNLTKLRTRLEAETERLNRAESDLTMLKTGVAETAAGTANDFTQFSNTLRKRTAKAAALREICGTLAAEVIPGVERALTAARQARQDAFIQFAKAAAPLCEARMSELIGAVLAERDAWVSCFDTLAGAYDCDFSGAKRMYPDGEYARPDPYRPDAMILTGLDERLSTQPRGGPYLTPPPAAQDAPQVAPTPDDPDAPDAEPPKEATLDTEAADSDAHVALGDTPTAALDTQAAAPTVAPAAEPVTT